MPEVSRTVRVIQNAKVAIFFYCINLGLQFFSRKIFLDCLGAELLGLNTTVQNLLQFLNLAESGIGAAVAFSLYKPLSQGNTQEIINIVSLQGWLYRRVGWFLILGSLLLMSLFPWIFARTEIPLIYAYGTFICFLIGALLGYFVNYKIVVLSADQKEYKITIEIQTIKVIKIFLQMFAVWKLPQGYVWWMFLEAAAAVVTAIRLNRRVSKEYPWLSTNIVEVRTLKQQYDFILRKTKQLFFHKTAGYVLTQTTPLVIYSFTTLSTVALYGNYLVVMTGCLVLVDAFFKGFSSSVGNLVAEGNVKHIKQTFWKIVTLKLFVAGGICSGLLFLTHPFIKLWVGSEYQLPNEPVLVMIIIYFIQMTRTCDMFISAYGLFQDIWAPIIESILCLSLSILGGHYWGLSGILLGVLISQILVVNSWKAYFLYSRGFNDSIKEYLWMYTKKVFILLGIIFLLCFSFSYFDVIQITSFSDWLINATIVISVYVVSASLIFYCLDADFRKLTSYFLGRIFPKTE